MNHTPQSPMIMKTSTTKDLHSSQQLDGQDREQQHGNIVAGSLLFIFSCMLWPYAAQAQPTFEGYTPPDHKEEPVSPSIAFFPQMGQYINTAGQVEGSILYRSHGHGLHLFVRKDHTLSFVLPVLHADTAVQDTAYRLDMALTGDRLNDTAPLLQDEETEWYHNYYLAQCPQGLTEVYGYRRLVYEDVYPDTDLHIYSNPWGYKLYFVVRPGGDPENIELLFQGQDSLALGLYGELQAYMQGRELVFPTAIAYQVVNGQTVQVPWFLTYQIIQQDVKVAFGVGSYNNAQPLVFDMSWSMEPMAAGGGGDPNGAPYPEWSTYYGGSSSDWLYDIAAMEDKGVAGCGVTPSFDFPEFAGNQPNYGGGAADMFYTRFNDQYSRMHSTFFGGAGGDGGYALAEYRGGVIVAGNTDSQLGSDFWRGPEGAFVDGSMTENAPGTMFIALFNPGGDLYWSTLFGHDGGLSTPVSVKVDAEDNIIIAGNHIWGLPQIFPFPSENTCQPSENTFPICGDGYQQGHFTWAPWSAAPVEWELGFLAKFNENLQLVWSTLFGGSAYLDRITGMDVDLATGAVFISGTTLSPEGDNPPCQPPAVEAPGFPWCPYDDASAYFQTPGPPHYLTNMSLGQSAFVARFNAGNELVWCTAFGDMTLSHFNEARDIVAAGNGRVLITGETSSTTYAGQSCVVPTSAFPVCNTSNPFTHAPSTFGNGFVAEFAVQHNGLTWSSFVGEGKAPWHIDADKDGRVFIAGWQTGGNSLMLAHPDYFTITDAGHPGLEFIMGFDEFGQFWGSRWGGAGWDRIMGIAAGVEDQRVYIAGHTQSAMDYPLHCPATVDPWCALLLTGTQDAFYGQLRRVLDPLSVQEEPPIIQQTSGLTAHPNPSTGLVEVSWPGAQAGMLEVRTAQGALVMRQRWPAGAGRMVLDLGHLADGLYLLRLDGTPGTAPATTRIILQR